MRRYTQTGKTIIIFGSCHDPLVSIRAQCSSRSVYSLQRQLELNRNCDLSREASLTRPAVGHDASRQRGRLVSDFASARSLLGLTPSRTNIEDEVLRAAVRLEIDINAPTIG